jgi:hypothetical protein
MTNHRSRNGRPFKDARFPGIFTERPLKTPCLPEIRIADGQRAH